MRNVAVVSFFLCFCATGCGQKSPEPVLKDSVDVGQIHALSSSLVAVVRDSILADDPKLGPAVCTVRRYGPFELRNAKDVTFEVFVEVGHVRFTAEHNIPFPESDYFYAIVNPEGKVLYRVSSPWGSGEDTQHYEPVQLSVPTVGPLVLLMSRYAPSTADEGLDGQLFGLDPIDDIVPYSGTLGPTGGSSASEFRPVLIKMTGSNSTASEYATDGKGVPAIEMIQWMGYFDVYKLFAVWGRTSPATRLYQTRYRIAIDSIQTATFKESYRSEIEDSTVMVYVRPSKSNPPTTRMPIRRESSIRFIDAINQDGWWLHVVIDGIEGYVIEEDFIKLGLAPAG